MRKILSILSLLLLIGGLGVWGEYKKALVAPVVIGETKLVEIKRGDSFNTISDKLVAQGVLIKPLWFKVIAYQTKLINKLKAGEFELKAGLTATEVLNTFVKGKTHQYLITFPEGWSFKQILMEIQHNPYLKKTLKDVDFQTIMAKLASDYNHPEGLFFPDTYFFDKNTTDFSILQRAYKKMQVVLHAEWLNKEHNLPIENAYQALILASIIEKETGAAVERGQISGVFTRRLRKGMLLQTDPTVIYGMGDSYDGNIRYKDLRERTAYNTYVIKGLPPTPIAMPGKAAIYAALHPVKGETLYFVAKGKGRGTHVFSATLREHNNAVNKYQRHL